MRHFHFLDKILIEAQSAIETVFGNRTETRENPAKNITETALTSEEKKHSTALMRINHTGEVCAQALYRGQLAVAQNENTQKMLEKACLEETDHLAWCDDRIQELAGHRSYLNAFFYWNSFWMGVVAGKCGDTWSLGFIEETEKQVGKHLEDHLKKLSPYDEKSRKILEQMAIDEAEHGASAKEAGGKDLPLLIQKLMTLQSKVMTTTTYFL